jgi:hypothetical protein
MNISGRCHHFCGLSPPSRNDVDGAGAIAAAGGVVVDGVDVDGIEDAAGGTIGSLNVLVGDVGVVVAITDVEGVGCEEGGAVVVVVGQMTIGEMGVPPRMSQGGFWARAVPDEKLSPITRARARMASSRIALIVDPRL